MIVIGFLSVNVVCILLELILPFSTCFTI